MIQPKRKYNHHFNWWYYCRELRKSHIETLKGKIVLMWLIEIDGDIWQVMLESTGSEQQPVCLQAYFVKSKVVLRSQSKQTEELLQTHAPQVTWFTQVNQI